MKDQHQRPEGRLIEHAMKTAKPKLSGRKLAERVGLSEGRIRQILNGYRIEGGQVIQIIGPADTVARMAEAAGVPAAEMRAAGREDAADEMSPLKSIGVTEAGDLWLADNADRLVAMREWLDSVQFTDAIETPPIELLSLWDFEQLMEAALVKHKDELRLKDYFIEMFGRRQTSSPMAPDPVFGGDGNADNPGGSAPNKVRPVDPLEVDEAAYDPERDKKD